MDRDLWKSRAKCSTFRALFVHQVEEVVVVADEMRRSGSHGQVEIFFIFGISRERNNSRNFANKLGKTIQPCEKCRQHFIRERGKPLPNFGTTQNFPNFAEHFGTQAKLNISPLRQTQTGTRWAIRASRPLQEHHAIKHHAARHRLASGCAT